MPSFEHILAVAREWVVKAENDFKNATNTLKMGVDCPTDTVCFHAQQCLEKYLKASLVCREIPVPKTHNLSALVVLLPGVYQALLSKEEQALLTEYATVTRYPGDFEEITLAEARGAVRVARRARTTLRRLLPKGALPVNRKVNGTGSRK